MTGGQWIDDPY